MRVSIYNMYTCNTTTYDMTRASDRTGGLVELHRPGPMASTAPKPTCDALRIIYFVLLTQQVFLPSS